MSADEYETKLSEWKKRHGVPEDRLSEEIPTGELRMISEDAKSTGKSYCWMCADEFPIKEMIIETSPYNQMEDAAIDESGYISEQNRVRKCKACEKRERDEESGRDEGEGP